MPNSIHNKKQQKLPNVETHQATRNAITQPKGIKETVPEDSSSMMQERCEVVEFLACLEKSKVYLAKSERMLKESTSISKQLRENIQSDLLNVAETLQKISRQILDYFTRPDFSSTVEKQINENAQALQEGTGLAITPGQDLVDNSAYRARSCPKESPKLPPLLQQRHEQLMETRDLRPGHSPSISNPAKHEFSLPKARCVPTNGTKEISHPDYVELNKCQPGPRAPICKAKNQGGKDLPTSANQPNATCNVTPRSCSDKLPFTRKQNHVTFSDILGNSEDLCEAKHKSEIYLPSVPERVPIHHNDLTRAIRRKQDHNMRELFGL